MRFHQNATDRAVLTGIPVDKETRQLLAWYVNGTLAGTDRDRVEAALQDSPEAASHVAWEKAVHAAVKNDPAYDVPADRGLFQVMQRIQADAGPKTTRATPAVAEREGWFSRFVASFRWTPALALSCGVVAVQFAVIAQMWTTRSIGEEYSGVRAVVPQAQPAGAFIRVAFKPETAERDVIALLRAARAEIVAGPSQLGDYYLLIDRQAADEALTLLQQSASVESADFANALPARP